MIAVQTFREWMIKIKENPASDKQAEEKNQIECFPFYTWIKDVGNARRDEQQELLKAGNLIPFNFNPLNIP